MKCAVCRGPAVIDLRRHNANFCADHFLKFCRDQVVRAIDEHDMIQPGERVLVAVSGGKDSLALWDLLLELGYDTEGMTIGLGIGDYSTASTESAAAFAECRDLTLHRIHLRGDYDYDIPTASAVTRRAPCSSCGLSKRHLIDKAALDGGYDVVATGHNLDDEAAVLFGNVLHWHTEYLGRQQPTLAERIGPGVQARSGLPAQGQAAGPAGRARDGGLLRAAPHRLHRRGVPDGRGQSPPPLQGGAQRRRGRIARRQAGLLLRVPGPGRRPLLTRSEGAEGELRACVRCGSPTPGDVCAFCRLVDQVAGHDPVPVELVRPRRGGRRAPKKARS